MTTLELLQYYANLLIFQYQSKPKAYAEMLATIQGFLMAQTSTQSLTFSLPAGAGSFIVSYNGVSTAAINWNDSQSTIQTKIQAIPALASATVSGSIASQSLIVTFTGVNPPAPSLVLEMNTLTSGITPVSIVILETDQTLPLAIQNAFNLTVAPLAAGVQLDVIGKYVGASRNGYGVSGRPITLNDSDYMILIKLSIIKNNNGSSLYDITTLLWSFFQGTIQVYDTANMHLTYFVASTASTDLIELFITQNILPSPMAVGTTVVVYAPIINALFGFVTYINPVQPSVTRPFNSYTTYHTDWPWLSYQDAYKP